MIQVRAAQAKRIFLTVQRYPGLTAELLSAFVAGGVPGLDENDDIFVFGHNKPPFFEAVS